jgi:hypothetical protein
MPMRDVVIFTAADARFFRLCLGLVLSLLRAAPERPRIRILDLGLAPDQIRALAPLVEAILPPRWHVPARQPLPVAFRGFTARPFLPSYVDDAEVIVWLDADTWVQEWAPLAGLIEASRQGPMAIVEERYGPDLRIRQRQGDGSYVQLDIKVERRRENVKKTYRECFGEEIAASLGDLPSFNGGVWALRRDAPGWAVYAELLEAGLSRAVSNLTEQQALNIAIRTGRIPVSPQPTICNFTLNQDLPAFDSERNRFVRREPPHEPIGVIHFTDLKFLTHLTLTHIPAGDTRAVPIQFLDWLGAPLAPL